MVLPLSRCFAGLALFAACFDASVCLLLPAEAELQSLKGLLVSAVVAKVCLAWATTTLKFELGSLRFYIRMLRTQAIACSLWISCSVIVAVELLVSENRRIDLRFALFACLRLTDLFLVVGVVAEASRLEGNLRDIMETRDFRLCKLDDLNYDLAKACTNLNKLSCCVCFDEFQSEDMIAIYSCNHTTHLACEHKLRPKGLKVFGCPMLCKCYGPLRGLRTL
eukprot:TRINITY_DN24848_c0_g1_i1.p1 TRINITY_DN24848_c0_g1~~TRINITY_DN24848_c0_g1_i1.p1  ORF type:complete len:238 (+),score=20.08 TRINITY_DN24848_c0_g1_i1:49-714(+)